MWISNPFLSFQEISKTVGNILKTTNLSKKYEMYIGEEEKSKNSFHT